MFFYRVNRLMRQYSIYIHVYSPINQNKIMGMIFLDIAMAFNRIDHEILYKKLLCAGMSDRVVQWFRSYLNQSQLLRYGETVSENLSLTAGIAQGTVRGQLIFIFYMNNCVNVLNRCKIRIFADDCVLYYTGNNWESVHAIIQNDLDRFIDWMSNNILTLNNRKTMLVGTRNKMRDPIPFVILNNEIGYVKKYTYLGITLDSEMSLVPLCKTIEKRVVDNIFST